MRASHAADPDTSAAGVDVVTGGVGDMHTQGIYEAFKVKNAALLRCAWGGGRQGGEASARRRVQQHASCRAAPTAPPCWTLVCSATEAAEMILRVDDIIKAAPRRREG